MRLHLQWLFTESQVLQRIMDFLQSLEIMTVTVR